MQVEQRSEAMAALDYHRQDPPGKIKVYRRPRPLVTQRDLALAYSPGVAAACEAIVADRPNMASEMTARGNLVAVITNGTAVLGLGDIGPLAGKPVMEGKGVLFQKFAGIDVFDIEVNERDPDKLVDIIASLEPTFGGINLEDIKAPECFIVERKLRERMNIPVFHDDQHGTAIIVGAAVLNALEVAGKKIEDVKLATSGAGAAGIACLDMLVALGLKPENILAVDRDGVLYTGRAQIWIRTRRVTRATPTSARWPRSSTAPTSSSACPPAACSSAEMVATMAPTPIILALANPYPEILPEHAKRVRPDCIIATGRSDYPNQVNNALCFPYIFRGALDVGAHDDQRSDEAGLRARDRRAGAQGGLRPGQRLRRRSAVRSGRIPDPATVRSAPAHVDAGAVRWRRRRWTRASPTRPIADMAAYAKSWAVRVPHRPADEAGVRARAQAPQARGLCRGRGGNVVLRAVQTVIDEGLALPDPDRPPGGDRAPHRALGLRMRAGVDFELTNIDDDPRFNDYWQQYHALTERRGVTPGGAKNLCARAPTVIAALMVERGEADAMICGIVGRYHKKLGYLRSVFDFDPACRAPRR
jgi:malate dehydrogenase (oxaloacetate-decarboxylating)(NADP+)